LCWSHARRQFFELADIAANARRGKNAPAISPVALEAVKRIDALFDIERNINGLSAEERLRVRQERSAPILAALEAWLREERSRLSRSASVAKPIDYMLRRWDRFVRFIDDGRVCLSNNAAERALRGFALGRKSWLFAGSERGADRAATMATLIMTAKLNDIDPLAWLADVLGRIADIPQSRLPKLLPWNWKHSNLRWPLEPWRPSPTSSRSGVLSRSWAAMKTCYGSCPTSSSPKTGSCGFTISMALKPPPSPTMASRLFAKLSRIRSIAPVNLKTSVPRCSAYAYASLMARGSRPVVCQIIWLVPLG
jgi:hypothetical protein